MALGFWVPFGGRPASAAEERLGASVELDAGGLSQSQQPTGEVDQVVGVGLLDGLESCQVGTEVADYVTLLGALSFESVDVYGLSPELVAEGFLALPADRESGSQPDPRFRVSARRASLGIGVQELNGRGGLRA